MVENRDFFIPPAFDGPVRGGSQLDIAIPFGAEKLEWRCYEKVKKSLMTSLAVSTQYRRMTDRRLATA